MVTETQQMLRSAGFTDPQQKRYLTLQERGETDACVRMLRRRRCELVDALHEAQRPIDIVDWELYRLERQQ